MPIPNPCTGLGRLNPMCASANAADVTGAIGAATDPFGTIAGYFSGAANNATAWLWDQLNDATTLDLNSPHLVREIGITAAIAAVLCVGLFLVQVIGAALRGHPVMLGRAFSGLIISFVGSAFAIATTRVLLGAVDALSNGVVQATLGTNIDGIGEKLAFIRLGTLSNPAATILFSFVVLASVAIVWAAMMIRKMMILLAAVLAPLAFAGATADFTRGWVRKWIEFMAAMIASKLLLVIILSLGIFVVNGAGQSGSGPTQTVTQLAGGSLILLLGGLAPWVAIRMFHFAGDSLYAAHSVARQSSAGAQSVIAAPQKMAALQGSARALTGGFRSRGGGSSVSAPNHGGFTPPAPPRPTSPGTPGVSGGQGAGMGAQRLAGVAGSTNGAAAAASSAIPVAGLLASGAMAAGSVVKGAVNQLPTAAQSAAGPQASHGAAGGGRDSSGPGSQPPPKQPPASPNGRS